MLNRKSVITACVAAIAMLTMTVSGNASVFSKENRLKFTAPVALPGVTLASGTYIFEQPNMTSPHIVRVLSSDRSRVYFQALTTPITRPAGMPAGMNVSLGEPQPGAATPIIAWYPVGDSTGHRFIYGR